MNILYIGRYELPDKDATANRVVANAKLLRSLGHNVTMAGWSSEVKKSEGWRKAEFFGFECYEKYKERSSKDKMLTFLDAKPELKLIKDNKYDLVIAYNFPAVAFKKIFKYCRKNNIKCIADVTEWFTNGNGNIIFRAVRKYDSYLRMKVLHKKIDGLIVISRYLEDYYKDQKTVLVPPLADLNDEKFLPTEKPDDGITRFIYAGWPSRKKERLDLIVDAIKKLSAERKVKLDIYGIDSDKYKSIYQAEAPKGDFIEFHGRVPHKEAVNALKTADYSFIIRDSSRKNNAGFPSKLVESIACGTPVLVTDISNVKEFVGDGKNGYIVSEESLYGSIKTAIDNKKTVSVDRNTFKYENYAQCVEDFLKNI